MMPRKPLKDRIRAQLEEGKLEEVEEEVLRARRVLGTLTGLTFDADAEVAWRAIEAMGGAVGRLAEVEPVAAKEQMRKLYWLITEESGGFMARAPECMAECAARSPDFFKNHIPIAFHLLETLEEEDLEHFRPGAIWAVGRLIDHAGDHLPAVLPLVIQSLDRPDAQSRGMAVWCLGEVGEAEALAGHPELLEDQGVVHLYRDRTLEETTVGALTREVLDRAAANA